MGSTVKSIASWGQFGGAQKTIQGMGLSTDEAMLAGGNPFTASTLRGKADGPATYQANAAPPPSAIGAPTGSGSTAPAADNTSKFLLGQ